MRSATVCVGLLALAALAQFTQGASAAPGSDPDPQPVYAVSSVAAMKLLNEKYPNLHVRGYYDGSSRGGGDFSWVASARGAPDNCITFSGPDTNGHWVRQLANSVLDVTMCGAKWDNAADDSAAVSAAFTVASRSGFSVSCPGGTGKIGSTVAPASFQNVIFRCQGIDASTINCAVPSKHPCFLFQNAKGSTEVQAPQLYDFNVNSRSPSVVIQYNSPEAGFTDDPTSQQYMMRPVVQRVHIAGGEIGIQCSKCFDGDISLNWLSNQDRHGIDLEGSDWMSIGGSGSNRIVSAGDYPIKLASRGTFGNGALVTHNDILSPRPGVPAYIYSSARTSYIEKNFLEGNTKGPCEIKIDRGALHAIVRDNHVTDPTVTHWLCVVPRLAQSEFSSNQTTSYGQGPALFEGGRGEYNTVMPQTVVHFGNWSESGFP
jgi:hypothetical protein